MITLPQTRERYNRIAQRLTDPSLTRHQLIDIATVLTFLGNRLEGWVDGDVEAEGMGLPASAIDASLGRMRAELDWLRSSECADASEVRPHVESALREAYVILDLLEKE